MTNAIDKVKKFLVTKAEELIDKYKDNFITSTQINNMIGLSNDSCCREEIENFVKYQIGRAKKSKKDRENWSKCGSDILEVLELIEKKLKDNDNQVDDDTIVKAIVLFFGYLKRYYKYAVK